MRRLRALGLDEVIARARRRGRAACSASASGMQLLFERSDEHEGADGARPAARRGDARCAAPKLPHIGWNLVTFARASRARPTGSASAAAFYHVHSLRLPRPPTRPTSSAAASTASAFASIVERDNVVGVQFHPEKSSRDGLRCCATSPNCRESRRDPLPGDRHPRRQGRAPRRGPLRGRRPSTTTTRSRPRRAWVDAGARFLHVVDLDGARSGEPRSIEHLRRIVARAPACRSSTAAGCARLAGGARGAAGRRRARDRRHRRVPRRRLPRRRCSPPSARASSSRSTSAAATISTAGWTQTTQMPAGGRDPPPRATAACRSFVYTDVDRDGMLEGPDLDEVRKVAEAVRGRFLYSGGIGDVEHLQRARRAAPGQPRRA